MTARDWQLTENEIRTSLILPAIANLGSDVSCIWGFQSGDRLTKPVHISLQIGEMTSISTNPEVETAYVPSNPNGQQVEITSMDQVEFILQVDVFSSSTESVARSAKYVAQAIRNYLQLCSTEFPLVDSGLALVECSQIQAIPTVLESKYESRARLEARFRAIDGTKLKTTWIETVTAPQGTIT